MRSDNHVRRNLSLDPRVDSLLDEYAAKWETSRSQIVNDAVLEYVDKDRTARIEEKTDRIEEKLDQLLDRGEGDLRETLDENKNFQWDTHGSDSGSKIRQRPDEIYDTLMDNHGDSLVIELDQIIDTIDEWWGVPSDHMVSKYLPIIGEKLVENGWYHIPEAGYWCQTAEKHSEMLNVVYRKSHTVAQSPTTTESVRERIEMLEANRRDIVQNDVADTSDINSVLSDLETHEKRLERRE